MVQFVMSPHFVSSLLFVGLLIALRTVAGRWVNTTHFIHKSMRMKALSHLRSVSYVFFLVGMLYIWGEQTQSLLIALFALIYAFARTAQGILACIGGSTLKTRSQAYKIGDRIRVGKSEGDVIESNWLSTTLLEGGASGRKIIFSHAKLLNEPIYNESLVEGFSFDTIEVAIGRKENWKMASQLLIDVAQEQTASFIDSARRRLAEVEKKQGLELPAPDPKVSIDLESSGQIVLKVRLLVPSTMKERVRSAILHTFLDKFYPICSVTDLLEKKISQES